MRTRIVSAIAVFALLAASPAEAFRVRPLPVRLGTLNEYPNSFVAVASLSNGNFVLVAEPWVSGARTLVSATAQVFRPDGGPVGEEIHCGESPTTFGIYHPTVVPDRDGFVFVCQSYHRGSNKLFTTEYRRYDARGVPLGDTVMLDDMLITELQTVAVSRDGTVLLTLEEFDGSGPVSTNSRAYDRFDRLVSLQRSLDYYVSWILPSSDGFLIANGPLEHIAPRIQIQRTSSNGTPFGPIRSIRWNYGMRIVRGPGGRLAASSVRYTRGSAQAEVRVVLIEGVSVHRTPVRVTVPHVFGWKETVSAVLPLEDGFVVVWSSEDRVETDGNGWWTYNASYAQRYSDTGLPVGKTIEIGRNSSVSSLVTFEEASKSWLLTGVEYDDPREELHNATDRFWRLNLGSTWGERR